MTQKKDVLDMMFSDEIFSCLENSHTSDAVSEQLVQIPFEFYEQRFHPKPKEVILSELLQEVEESKDEQLKSLIALGLSYKFDDLFREFVELFLKMHPCSKKKVTVDEVFDLFEKMYFAYQRMVLYRKWKNM